MKAIIDLGTNTCNLVIAQISNNKLDIKYSTRRPVILGKGGINKKILTSEAIDRGVKVILEYKSIIDTYPINEVMLIGTSAMRNANNRDLLIHEVKEKTGYTLKVIDGNREAELIYKGVNQAIEPSEGMLILDIGGGSNEFILANKKGILWKYSFDIGMARVLEHFDLEDPISNKNILEMEQWYNEELEKLWQITAIHPCNTLIGASGAFDTFLDLIEETEPETERTPSTLISMKQYKEMHKMLINTPLHMRLLLRGMEPMRVEMIVLASIFVNFIVNKLSINKMIQSTYSLKEGLAFELLNK